jgi:hypothetical protein
MLGKITAIGIAVIFCGIVAGCSHNSSDTGVSPKEAQTANRLDDIASKSGGDWNKLSPSDKAYLLQISSGSESTAKMVLLTHSGKFSVNTGAPSGHPAAPAGVPTGAK